ncbi:MAG: outer membrane beta-barrel protein [Bacteroidota bacterium]
MYAHKRIYPLFALLLFTATLLAQRFEGSLVAGTTFAQLNGDNLAGYNKLGLVAGGRVAAVLNPKWRLSMDILYSQRGSRRGEREVSTYHRFALNYVEVPVMIYLTDWKIEFGTGFSYNHLINYSIEDINGEDATQVFDLKNNDLAFVADATYYTNPNFGIGLRWNQGLFNIDSDAGNQGLVNRWISFRFIYRFNVSNLADTVE